MKLLLHACCGPCLSVPGKILAAEVAGDGDFAIYFANSNIHPDEEYILRRDACKTYATAQGWEFIEGPYDPEIWDDTVADDLVAPRRCRLCYRVRFKELARAAAYRGYDTIATTLSVSPYQDQRAIEEELTRAAQLSGVRPLYRDFSEHYPETVRLSKELKMYRQKYCGCRYSEIEAQRQRDERKAARAAKKKQTPENRAGETH